jgi:putative transposase
MKLVNRRVTYRLYPSQGQEKKLKAMLSLHQQLYNVALEQRIEAWKQRQLSITFAKQCREFTQLKAGDADYAALNSQSCQVTLKRLDLAFKAFFRRVKKGETPGFPRFKSLQHFTGWGYKTHGDGWRLFAGEGGKHGHIRISGIGNVSIRGKGRTEGTPKILDIQQRRGRWYASVVISCTPTRSHGKEIKGFDWGLENFLTFHDNIKISNPRFFARASSKLAYLHRQVASKKLGSRNRQKSVKQLARESEKVANRRANFHHQIAAKMVSESRLIATEKLETKRMSRSAAGSVKKPGGNVRQKAGLNKGILDSAPSAFLEKVRYKAEEAGIVYVEVPTRQVKPSQTCPACGKQRKKLLSERTHRCDCGCVIPRDQAAALVCLNFALAAVGNRPCGEGVPLGAPLNHETHSITA